MIRLFRRGRPRSSRHRAGGPTALARGVVATAAWAGGLSYAIIKLVGATVGLRVSDEDETEGLDITTHGERSYDI